MNHLDRIPSDARPALAARAHTHRTALLGVRRERPMATCTVCGKELDAELMTDQREANGETIYLCCPQCQSVYDS